VELLSCDHVCMDIYSGAEKACHSFTSVLEINTLSTSDVLSCPANVQSGVRPMSSLVSGQYPVSSAASELTRILSLTDKLTVGLQWF